MYLLRNLQRLVQTKDLNQEVVDQVVEIRVDQEVIAIVIKVYIIQLREEVAQQIKTKMRNPLHIHAKHLNSSF